MFKFLSVFAVFILSISGAWAHESDEHNISAGTEAHIVIEKPYAFATMPGGATGAVFMTIKNTGGANDNLIEVSSAIAKTNEIHENIIDPDDGKMMMRKIKNIPLPAQEEAVLEPKGKHVMLIGLKEPLTIGGTFPLTLIFEKSGKQKIDVQIIQPGSTPDAEVQTEIHSHGDEAAHEDAPVTPYEDIPSEQDEDFPVDSFAREEKTF